MASIRARNSCNFAVVAHVGSQQICDSQPFRASWAETDGLEDIFIWQKTWNYTQLSVFTQKLSWKVSHFVNIAGIRTHVCMKRAGREPFQSRVTASNVLKLLLRAMNFLFVALKDKGSRYVSAKNCWEVTEILLRIEKFVGLHIWLFHTVLCSPISCLLLSLLSRKFN